MRTFGILTKPNRTVASAPYQRLISAAVAVITMLAPLCASADQSLREFSDAGNKISLSYPTGFDEVRPAYSPALLVLRQKQRSFPTFNLIVQPGTYNFSTSLAQQEAALIHSYKLVGITDAKLRHSNLINLETGCAFQAQVSFNQSNADFIAWVTIMSGSDRRFIMTFVDRGSDFLTNQAQAKIIINSFRAPDLQERPLQSCKSSHRAYFVLLGCAGLCLVFWIGVRLQRISAHRKK